MDTNMSELERAAYRASIQDGLTEIFMGMMLLFISNLYQNVIPIGVIIVFLVFIIPFAVKILRETYIYPRTGYVKLKRDVSFDFIPFIIFLFFVLSMSGLLIMLLPGQFSDSDNLYRIMPFTLGMVMFGPALELSDKSGQDRYLLYGVFPTISGLAIVVLSVLDEPWTAFRGLQIFTILWGIIFLIIGFSILLWFFYKNPVQEGETDD